MHFLELIKRFEEESSDLAAFLEYFDALDGEERYVHVNDQNALRLLTIHKAKGLEFGAVILPFLEMDVQPGSSIDMTRQSYVLRQRDDAIGLLRLKSTYYGYSDALYQIHREEYKKAFIAELNTLYVALTRARCELYGFIPKKSGSSFNLATLFIPPEWYSRGQQGTYPSKKKERGEVFAVPAGQSRDWIAYLADEFIDADALRNRRERREGEVIHYLLAHVRTVGDDAAVSRALAHAAAVAHEQWGVAPEMLALCREKVLRLVSTDAMKEFFCNTTATVYTEKEIVMATGATKRIDRLMVFDPEVWIIDYKTGAAEAQYVAQITEYKTMVARLYPSRRVRGFLVFVDGCRMEEV